MIYLFECLLFLALANEAMDARKSWITISNSVPKHEIETTQDTQSSKGESLLALTRETKQKLQFPIQNLAHH